MNLAEFAAKWQAVTVSERAAAQEHFLDLCALLNQQTPAQADPTGTRYTFEKGVTKVGGDAKGYADVWKKDFFAWEYKGKRKNLDDAYKQVSAYHDDLGNPPCLVVCDLNRFVVRLKVTNLAVREWAFDLQDLAANTPTETCPDLSPVDVLRAVMNKPKDLYPAQSVESVTEEIAKEMGKLAVSLSTRGHDGQTVAGFLIRILFCLFAEDIGLLDAGMFTKTVETFQRRPRLFQAQVSNLFAQMATGGAFGTAIIRHFNGGLFADTTALELNSVDLTVLLVLARKDWKAIEPSIFGTLFERSLDPQKRSQLGAHYTSRADIEAVVEPVMMPPIRRDWDATRTQADVLLLKKNRLSAQLTPDTTPAERARVNRETAETDATLTELLRAFTARIQAIRVLDPACGSGNFLYVALRYLLDAEQKAIEYAYRAGLTGFAPGVSPEQMRGIELNDYAHELAPVTIWIGYLQWLRENNYLGGIEEPILRKMDMVQGGDALMTVDADGKTIERPWEAADYIVGNPPFLGGNKLRQELGDAYVERLFATFAGRVPAFADLVCYWFEKARAMVESGVVKRAGLIATNSIRNGTNRKVLERIKTSGEIFIAWSDREWTLDGAAVRVSIVGFDNGTETVRMLNGVITAAIHSDLTGELDLTKAVSLPENANIAFTGTKKGGAFNIDAATAQQMLAAVGNPNRKPNSDVVKPWINGTDLNGISRKMYIIDFGVDMSEDDAALYEAPFEYIRKNVKPELERKNVMRPKWWLHERSRPEMRQRLRPLSRFIATVLVAKHRIFVYLTTDILPDSRIVVITRDDDYFLGVLQSRVHEVWSLAVCTFIGKGNDPCYNSSRTFDTFPFPYPPGTEPTESPQVQAIAAAAKRLDTLRQNWLNPENAPPTELRTRTLTALYNARPAWLNAAHAALDTAVLAAYGFAPDLHGDALLAALLTLNAERATQSNSNRQSGKITV